MTNIASLGDDFALLSLRVAQQVDRKLGGKSFDTNVLRAFKSELVKAAGNDAAHTFTFLHADPITTEVFAQAFFQTSGKAVSSTDELTAAIKEIIEPLDEEVLSSSEANLASVKSFCLALHRSMMSHALPPIHEGEESLEDELGFAR